MDFETIDKKLKMPVDPKLRGAILRESREKLGLSQNEIAKLLAERLGVDKFEYKRISDWETGRIKTIPEDVKLHLYAILKINEAEDLVIIKDKAYKDMDDIYSSMATEFVSYVKKKVKDDEELKNKKELDYEVSCVLNGMFFDFLNSYQRRHNHR